MHPFWLIPGAIAFWHFIKWCTEENHEEPKHSNPIARRVHVPARRDNDSAQHNHEAAGRYPPTLR